MPSAAEGTSEYVRVGKARAHARHFGSGDRGILLLHGLASESRELGALPGVLAEHGFRVIAPDLRGHGESTGPRGRLSLERVLQDVIAWRTFLSGEGARLAAIGGHSLGGAWSVGVAARLEVEACFALCAPATITAELSAPEVWMYRAGGHLHRLATRIGQGHLTVPYKVGARDVLDDAASIARFEADVDLQDTVPLWNVEHLLSVDASSWAREVTCPGLVAAAARDRVVARDNTRAIHDAWAGPSTWLELDGPHSCFFSPEGRDNAEAVATWLDQALG